MSKSIEYYLSKGFSHAAAVYFSNGRKRMVAVEPNRDFTLTLTFEGGEKRNYDVKPLLEPGTVFEPLLDWNNFRRVYLDDCNDVCWDIDPNVDSNVVWNNKVDLCSDSCYIDSVPVGGAANV